MAGENGTEKMNNNQSNILAKLPPKLAQRLMPFQKEGVEFAVNKNGRCLIADEMGLGKTLQAISVAYFYKSQWPLLIIVPSSLRYCWIEEFEKWLPDVNPEDINLVQSGNDVSDIGRAQVTITTFGLLSRSTSGMLKEALCSQAFQVVIVDESHYIRNSKTVSAKTVVPLIKNASRRILLSGTPALSKPVELYAQIDAICPGQFGSWWSYTNKYCDAKVEWMGRVRTRNVNGASNLQELQSLLSTLLMIRREKNQVLTQLPAKQRQKVLFQLKDSSLKKDILQTFDELKPKLKYGKLEKFETLSGAAEHGVTDTNTLALITRLYKLSAEAKVGPAKEYVEMLCENPRLKFLVFAYHHAMMNGLSESLHDKHVKFIRIDGQTPPSERPGLVHQFQSDPDTKVAILSILAAGVGLTFTAASVVVFAELYWTPGTMVQCEDRAHRIGQTNCVAVHYLVAKDTMDEWMWSAVCKKTLVTSTTLTGEKRNLEALEGDRYQVDVLSNADVWVPTETSNESSTILHSLDTQLEPDQPSILEFFSSQKPKQQAYSQESRQLQSFLDKLAKEESSLKIRASHSGDVNLIGEMTHSPVGRPSQNKFLDQLGRETSSRQSGQSGSDYDSHRKEADTSQIPFQAVQNQDNTEIITQMSKKRKCSKDSGKPNSAGKSSNICTDNVFNGDVLASKMLNGSALGDCIIVDSDDDNDFVTKCPPSTAKSTSRKRKVTQSNKKGRPTTYSPSPIPRYTLPSAFNKASSRRSNIEAELVEIIDDEHTTSLDKNDQQIKHSAKHVSRQMEHISTACCLDAGEDFRDYNNVTPSVKRKKRTIDDNGCRTLCSGGRVTVASQDRSTGSHHTGNASGELWNCTSCTFLNHKALKYCEICETPKKLQQVGRMSEQRSARRLIETSSNASRISNCTDSTCPVDTTSYTNVPDTSYDNMTLVSHGQVEHSDTRNIDNSRQVNVDLGKQEPTDSPRAVKTSQGAVKNQELVKNSQKNTMSNPEAVKTNQDDLIVSYQSESDEFSIEEYDSPNSGQNENCESSLPYPNHVTDVTESYVSDLHAVTNETKPEACPSSSKYFMDCYPSNAPSPMRNRKELVIQNTLNVKPGDANTCIGTLEVSTMPVCPSPVACGSIDNKTIEEFNSPTMSAKKYRFRSVTKTKGSPVASMHLMASGDTPCSSTHKLRKESTETITQSDPAQLNLVEAAPEDNTTTLQASIKERRLSTHKAGFVETPSRREQASINDSFSSPEMDSILAAQVSPRPERKEADAPKHVVDMTTIPVYPMFKYRCSKYTGRVYILDQHGVAINANFIPIDVEMENLEVLPDVLLHPSNRRLAQKFVREWSSLTETKKRLLVKSNDPFVSPLQEYDRLKSCKTVNTQRYKSKTDTSIAAMQTAANVGGSIRVLSKPGGVNSNDSSTAGVSQVVGVDGTPHCLQCMKPYENHLLQKGTIQKEENAWQTRFCSQTCSHQYWMLTSTEYIRQKIFEVEHGVCQICSLDAHSLFKHIRDTRDEKKRVDILGNSRLSSLSVKLKHQMVKKPTAGLFWHVDHIVPVWEGGGQCDIDNLRTLCVKCHHKITAKQASKRATVRKLGTAVKSGDITAFFQKT